MLLQQKKNTATAKKMKHCFYCNSYYPKILNTLLHFTVNVTDFLSPNACFLRRIGTPPTFSSKFSKGDNFLDFLFAPLEDEVFPKWALLSNEFPPIFYKMTPISIRGNNENDKSCFR